MANNIQLLKGLSQSLFGKITVRSVQNSHIWLMGVFLLFILISALLKIPTWIIICLVLLLFILVVYYLYRDNYFMRNHPEYLRSETLHLAIQKLEMLGEKDKEVSAEIIIEGKNAEELPTVTKKSK